MTYLSPDPTGSDDSLVFEGLPSPLDSVADMRATAKWIVAAAASVGAVLLGGAPLTAVGKVHGVGHAVTSFAGLVIALSGVGWVIWHVSDALIPQSTTWAMLDSPALRDLRNLISDDPESFFGPFGSTVDELRTACRRHDLVAANVATMLAREQDPIRQRVLIQGLADARANAAMAHRRLRFLRELIHAWTVRAQLRRARAHAFLGAAATALGAVLFLVASSAPSAAVPPNPTATATATASR